MKILYISRTRLNYSLNSVYIHGLRQNGVEILRFKMPSGGLGSYLAALSFVRKNKEDSDCLIMGYDSSILAVFLRMFYRKKMIYCAVLPVYERLIISRKLAGRLSLKRLYYWLIDFLAFHFANLTMMESNHQIDRVSKFYFISKDKFIRSWIGVDEDNFFFNSNIQKFPKFTVMFRGALMPEAGAEYVVRAAKILEQEDINFIMLSGGLLLDKIKKLIEETGLNNLELRSDLLSYEELREIMQKCHLSLGQLSDHERLRRTVPHKVYESLALKLPYLTAANAGILELLREGETCITCVSADASSLAEKILWAKNNPEELARMAQNGYQLYQDKLRTDILARNLLEKIGEL